ncbi:hypothetical protein CHCC20335_3745 [Bacillus paralicheniformis]|nr:hypothetical protein CHCC20335_3745 [Bacillus paralicheniformis]
MVKVFLFINFTKSVEFFHFYQKGKETDDVQAKKMAEA